jgi:hypothetical protein
MIKIIQLRDNRTLEIKECGHCPFFKWNTSTGQYHECLLEKKYTNCDLIPQWCPLIGKEEIGSCTRSNICRGLKPFHDGPCNGWQYDS